MRDVEIEQKEDSPVLELRRYDAYGNLTDHSATVAIHAIRKDNDLFQISFYGEGMLFGEIYDPRQTIGYGNKILLEYVDQDTFMSYLEFLKTRKTSVLRNARRLYASTKR